ncbi:MAG: class I SAM-dependent methyltransferase [Candidatus Giovannonibacteria bacterium]|nr:MAG: class I SAM-dependent methyltransferase [Candidatus Giovannonibacteria bacterium]
MSTQNPFNKKIVREHDKLYLSENRKLKVKEKFKSIIRIADRHLRKLTRPEILDVGCATGDFLHYLRARYPNASLTGLDIMPALLKLAKREVPQASYVRGDIYTGRGLPKSKFDAVFLLAVHSIFDDVGSWLDNLLRLVKPNGHIFVDGLFNPEDVDVVMRVRYAKPGSRYQRGWNMFSQKTVLEHLRKRGAKGAFHRFVIGIDIPRHKDDPLRSWTFKLENGERAIINGTQILHQFYFLEITLGKNDS